MHIKVFLLLIEEKKATDIKEHTKTSSLLKN